MEEDALMDGRVDADADVTEKPSRGMPNIFFCLSARLRVGGLEKKPLSPTLLSAVQSSGVIFKRRLKSIMRRGELNEKKTNWWDVVWTYCKSIPNARGEEG